MSQGQPPTGRRRGAGRSGKSTRAAGQAELVAVFVHEIRSPLGVIANGLHILSHYYPGDGRLDELRQLIARQVGHITALVDSLLECSPLFSGEVRLRRERVELAGIVLRAVELATPLLDRANHRLSLRLPEGPLFLEVDPMRLVQVLANLLENAAKYTPPGGHIEVSVQAGSGWVEIAVNDDGSGIPAESLPHLFEPFFRSPETLERGIEGTGVGLALVRGLVEAHGGRVEVLSAGPGCGTLVRVRLPLPARR